MSDAGEYDKDIETLEKIFRNMRLARRLEKVECMDSNDFRKYIHGLIDTPKNPDALQRGDAVLCIRASGYFSTAMSSLFTDCIKLGASVQLLTQISGRKEAMRLYAIDLNELKKAGAQIKTNNNMHARMLLVDYGGWPIYPKFGVLVLGSFDFNKEGLGGSRHDFGIKTSNLILVNSASKFFERIWNSSESEIFEIEKYG